MAIRKIPGGTSDSGGEPRSRDGVSHPNVVATDSGASKDGVARRTVKIATVSHTLDAEVAERLRHFAFRERMSESAVIEYALRGLFSQGDDVELGRRLRDAGAALRRKI